MAGIADEYVEAAAALYREQMEETVNGMLGNEPIPYTAWPQHWFPTVASMAGAEWDVMQQIRASLRTQIPLCISAVMA